MDSLSYFFWLTKQAIGGFFYHWQVTVIIFLLLVVGLVYVVKKRKNTLYGVSKYLLLPLVGTILILLVGTIFKKEPKLAFTVLVMALITVILAGVSIYKTKHAWPVSTTSNIAILWFSFWCAFASGMSVSGDWM